tara:strand:+ start:1691 stop:1912 length:222 start_codon:yes stop_codon:yes gene_type:complete
MEKTMTEFGRTCQYCQVDHIVMADQMDVANWENGALIQDALYYLTADERELFMSGTCGACFDKMFPPDPENDD